MPEKTQPRVKTLVKLGTSPKTKEEAIEIVGRVFLDAGVVGEGFTKSMMKREATANTYLGNTVAIPHCSLEDKGLVKQDAIAVVQAPKGVDWGNGETACLIVGIAANSDSHITILRRLTKLMQNPAAIEELVSATSQDVIIKALDPSATVAVETPAADATSDYEHKVTWKIDYPAGLHARPASSWADASKKLNFPIRIRRGGDIADPRNMVSLLQLGARFGEDLVISGSGGEDVKKSLEDLKTFIMSLTVKEKDDYEKAAAAKKPANAWKAPSGTVGMSGSPASPGMSIGKIFRVTAEEISIKDEPISLLEGSKKLNDAINEAKADLTGLVEETTRKLGASSAGIFCAQTSLLNDEDLISHACAEMINGHGVTWAWNHAVDRRSADLMAVGNENIAARAADIRDVGRRVLVKLDPSLDVQSLSNMKDTNCVVVASDIAPSDMAILDTSKVVGLVMAHGGPTSHTAILARTMGIPAVVAAGEQILHSEIGSCVIVDGDGGGVWVDPSTEDLAAAKEWIKKQEAIRIEEVAGKRLPAVTTDGHQVEIAANVNSPDKVVEAIEEGADGVGLMRTEFLFLERDTAPTEDEQYESYMGMLNGLEGRPLIIRTLDIGGDKQVSYLRLPHEENPFLGVRGARLTLRRAELFEPQVRALYRAAKENSKFSIMFPMISSVQEIISLREKCEAIRKELSAPEVPLGIMVEVPAAAILADKFAPYVDFFSIGTNDLTQYTLAIDRQHPELAKEADSTHPAVLRMIHQTVQGAAATKTWVGVCGGMAGSPFGAALLTGLGVQELSMAPRDISSVKARIRKSKMSDLQKMAMEALTKTTAQEVKAMDVGLN